MSLYSSSLGVPVSPFLYFCTLSFTIVHTYLIPCLLTYTHTHARVCVYIACVCVACMCVACRLAETGSEQEVLNHGPASD